MFFALILPIDYWLSLLFKLLVDERVLSVANSRTPGRTVRVYAFCARQTGPLASAPGAVTLVVLNLRPTFAPFTVQLSGVTSFSREQYIFTAPGGNLASTGTLLNGALLNLAANGDFPPLTPVVVAGTPIITLPPRSFGFLVLTQANAPACL